MDRRTYLAAGTTLGAGTLAGCAFTAAASTVPPVVPEDELDSGGWVRTDEETGTAFEKSHGPAAVTAIQQTLRYADEALQTAVEGRTIDIDTGETAGTDRTAAVFPFEGHSFDPDAYREEIRSLLSSVR